MVSRCAKCTKDGQNRTNFVLSYCLILIIGIALIFNSYNNNYITDSTKSIVVIPFKSTDISHGDNYFNEGLTDGIVAQLSKIEDLKVISNATVSKYKSENDYEDIGLALNVKHILLGNVKQLDIRVQVIVKLKDTEDNKFSGLKHILFK